MKKIVLLLIALTLTSCSSIKDKMPSFERKACTGEKNTLSDVFCKK